MDLEQERLITENLSLIGRVVARETALGLPAWVDRSDLEDVANLALVKAALAFKAPGDFAAFAYEAVHCAVLDEIKSRRYWNGNRGGMPDIEAVAGEVSNQSPELTGALAALQGMYPRQYRAVCLFYWGGARDAINGFPAGMSLDEVAAEMKTTADSVDALLRRARKNIFSVLRRNSNSQSPIQVQGENGNAEMKQRRRPTAKATLDVTIPGGFRGTLTDSRDIEAIL